MPREAIAIAPTGRASRMSVRANEVLSGNRVLTFAELDSANHFLFDANGVNRTLDLPPEAACPGAFFWLTNTAAGAFTVQVRTSAGASIGAAIANGTTGMYACDGTTWRKVA